MLNFRGKVGIQAADLTGSTGFGGDAEAFEGLQIVDYDEIVDRSESLVLLEASHVLNVFSNSTQTADGVVTAGVEVSASPARSGAAWFETTTNQAPGVENTVIVGGSEQEDSIDLIGRVLQATGQSAFSDGATGVGGGGSAGEDTWQSNTFPEEYGQFHPRDELFMNGRIVAYNIDDSGVHVTVKGQHVYGVVED